MPDFTVRSATSEDAETVVTFINELAEYERLAAHARPNVNRLRIQLQPHASPRLYCALAFHEAIPVGFAIGYQVYSTFQTSWNFHLEDFYVNETARGKGVGRALFRQMCRVAHELGCIQLDLEVLKWNKDAMAAYLKWGGAKDSGWSRVRFSARMIATHASASL
ncbi:MAG: hypothetical protein JWL82_434 [Parcubacteria group bacterium]|nr:hypothetical protein [Parcubacteria group bacterium]